MRLWTSGMDVNKKTEVRPYGEGSPLLGHIYPHSGDPAFWDFQAACQLGEKVRSHLFGEHQITTFNEFEEALEKAWGAEVGDPSPDKKHLDLWFSPVEVTDRLEGEEVKYYDVGIWDVNLGAVMQRYGNAGWGDWDYWSPGTPVVDRIKGRVSSDEDRSVVCGRIRLAWQEEMKRV